MTDSLKHSTEAGLISVSREEARTATAMIVSSLLFSIVMATLTVGLTSWLSVRWGEHSGAGISPLDLFAFLFYLLDMVAVIRLLCFAGMLLSASRKDDAVDLMPAIKVERRFLGRLHSPSTSRCRQIGAAALLEAMGLCSIWAWSIFRLMHLQ